MQTCARTGNDRGGDRGGDLLDGDLLDDLLGCNIPLALCADENLRTILFQILRLLLLELTHDFNIVLCLPLSFHISVSSDKRLLILLQKKTKKPQTCF